MEQDKNATICIMDAAKHSKKLDEIDSIELTFDLPRLLIDRSWWTSASFNEANQLF